MALVIVNIANQQLMNLSGVKLVKRSSITLLAKVLGKDCTCLFSDGKSAPYVKL